MILILRQLITLFLLTYPLSQFNFHEMIATRSTIWRSRLVASAWMSGSTVSHGRRRLKVRQNIIRTLATTSSELNSAPSLDTETSAIYNELQWLSQEIRRHDQLYYHEQPEIGDDEFDALVQKEESISTQYPDLLQQWQKESGLGIAVTRAGRVGSNATVAAPKDETLTTLSTDRIKRKHLADMLSLDNVHNHDQLLAWLKRIPKVLDELDEEPDADGTTTPTRVTLFTEPKLDGVSLSLRYRREQSEDSSQHSYILECATTRGDGKQGQDVTSAVESISSIPSRLLFPEISSSNIALPELLEVRGEVVLPNSNFDQLSHGNNRTVTFSNPRNAASGLLMRKEATDPDEIAEATKLRAQLLFVAYDLVGESTLSLDGLDTRLILQEAGFTVPEPVRITDLDLHVNDTHNEFTDKELEPMLSYYQALKVHRDEGKKVKGFELGDFDMDGCVHKISQHAIRQLLGRSTKSPKWAVAHKFPPKAAVTQLLNVTIQIGRTGALTPVAELEPIDVGGVIIQRATLHNFGHMKEILGGETQTAVGTPVLVRRAGDVIPQVVQRAGIVPEASKGDEELSLISLEPPSRCPACNSELVVEDIGSTNALGQVIRCGGPPLMCPPRAITSMKHAFARDALDLRGLSEARIQQLMDAKFIQIPADVFLLDDDKWQAIADLPGWGEKSCSNLRTTSQQIAKDGVSLSRFIFALGARHLGQHTSELVASRYVTITAFLEALEEAGLEETIPAHEEGDEASKAFAALQGQLGIGPAVVQSLVHFAKNEEMIKATKLLAETILVNDVESFAKEDSEEESNISNPKRPWKGMRVVFTGKIPSYSRTDVSKMAKALGAKATPGSVSKSTDLVVFGDKGGKKLEEALSLGISTMPAEEFIALVERTNSV